ncbi:MAG TPA: helix-hairpin-helix domain-containing protein [Tepidisphaeraceae bacterium]|jgi:hypothetical protein
MKSPAKPRPKSDRSHFTRLEDLPNIGPAIARDLRRLKIMLPAHLKNRDPYRMYKDICRITDQHHDPCVLDTFIAVTRFMAGDPVKPWWHYTTERKRKPSSPRTRTN